MKTISMNCKVCKDAGKSEKEYTSHQPRDRDGKTTCPLLLSLNCRKCGKKGHTIKYCKVNTEKQRVVVPVQVVKAETRPIQGKFSSLVVDSSDEEGEETEPVQVSVQQKVLVPVQETYADKLKKNTQTLLLAPTLPDMITLTQGSRLPLAPMLSLAPTLSLVSQEIVLPKAPVLPITEEEKTKFQKLKKDCREIMAQKCNWADDSDSEDEDD
jgi:hypothetical protein